MQTEYFWLGAAIIVLLLDMWAINSVVRSAKSSATKGLWALLIVVFPLIGLVIWGIAGPRGIIKGPSSPEHSKG